jgi:hypothetical protein
VGGELNVDDPALNQHDSDAATATPLLHWLSTKHNLIDLATKAFPCKQIENTSKKVKQAIGNCRYELQLRQEGSSCVHKRTNRHSGDEQERGP